MKPGSASILHDILDWSKARPVWQRDTLRRIVVNGAITDAEIGELEDLCCIPHDAAEEQVLDLAASSEIGGTSSTASPPEPIPLATEHLPSQSSSVGSISLSKLGNLTNVNRLASSNAILFGASPGLSVIYGDNGTGKSGYARVIRKACRARGLSVTIEPNLYQNGLVDPASAEFTIRVNGIDKILIWKDGGVADPDLGRILFFDGHCAEHYVHEDGGTSFSPSGLDVLTKLTRVCDYLKDRIAKRMKSTQDVVDAFKRTWPLHQGTKVSAFLQNLSAASDEGKIASLSQWDATASARLEQVRTLLAVNALQQSAATQAAANRITSFREKLAAQIAALNGQSLATLQQTHVEFLAAQSASALASSQQFESGYLTGTGGDSWKLMWEAARQFSIEEAYPEVLFPNIAADALCIMCQTPLTETASARLLRFEAFVKNETTRIAEQKRQQLNTQIKTINALASLQPELTLIEGDLGTAESVLIGLISQSISECNLRKESLLETAKTGDWQAVAKIPSDPTAALQGLEKIKSDQAGTEAALHDPAARTTLQSELNELTDREWLSTNSDLIVEQIGRLKKLTRLQAAQVDTSTSQVTSKATSLSKTLVTDALCSAFADEILALGLRTIKVELRPAGGQKGLMKFGVRLAGISGNAVGKVASEGEKRCIAFALFLAELSQTSDASALVFDDPVSSVDHRHRERIAARISKEALNRQVIVFTHDPVFLHDLQTNIVKLKASISLGFVQWNKDTPGEWVEGLPWKWKSPSERFDLLRKDQQALAKIISAQPTEEDELQIRRVYARLRGTLERVIETQIFGDAISRFRTYINVKNVERVVGFSQAEFDELKRLFDKYSDVIEAHDPSIGQHKSVPDAQELFLDIQAAEKLVETVKTRQKSFAKSTTP
jgi:ABC-type molybdenum transport system ATPase subunit/photorepair protein PhrA